VTSDLLAVQLLVLAKTPVAGRVKTRLSPPLTPAGAARVAAAAIADTLAAARATPLARRVLVVDGPMTADGFDRQPQRGGPLDERLAAAYDDAAATCDLPALLIGMDTPQVTPALLEDAARALLRHDAVLGPSFDGGWWALGLQHPRGSLLLGVPTSLEDTGRLQRQRLGDAGLDVATLPHLSDVDTIDDAREVAAVAPHSRFAAALATELAPALAPRLERP
jgi:rSAM/selenodomain-associated transferase 1